MYLCSAFATNGRITYAEIAQLVEHNLAKVGVASSSLVFRSNPLELDVSKGFCFPQHCRQHPSDHCQNHETT